MVVKVLQSVCANGPDVPANNCNGLKKQRIWIATCTIVFFAIVSRFPRSRTWIRIDRRDVKDSVRG